MPIVSDFESSSVQEKNAVQVDQWFDYDQVEKALKVDKAAAENAFARCAKRHLRMRLPERIKMADLGECSFPVWFAHVSVTIDLLEATAGYVDRTHLRLHTLTEALISSILSVGREGREMLLVGSLLTSLAEVGPNLYSFSLKQKWGFSDE